MAVERVNYYERQFLGASDFRAQQNYDRDMRRRHNLGHHTWGIVSGLELREIAREGGGGAVDIFIMPGMAVDGFGREILVLQQQKLDPGLFATFANKDQREVWIAFDESSGKRSPYPDRCATTDQFARVNEGYVISIDPAKPHAPIVVAGKVVSPTETDPVKKIVDDESVPYQELENEAPLPEWLVRLGSVVWDGSAGKKHFVATNANRETLDMGRRYVGVVAQEALAPAKSFRLRPRGAFTDVDAQDFASVEGRLRVDGRLVAKKDALIHGGKLSFQNTAGGDEGHPLWMQRLGSGGAQGNDLRINLGVEDDSSKANVRLTIGAPTKTALAVRSDNSVDIHDPKSKLDFGRTARQMINLWSTGAGEAQYGIGVQTDTTYFRSHNQFCWFKNGVHDDAASAPGKDGALQLRLDAEGSFHFGETVRQMLNLWKNEYGIGVQAATLFFRSSFDFCWFRGGTFSPIRSSAGGGVLQMKLDEAGNLGLGIANPAVRFHVAGNRIRLESGGKIIDLRADGSAVDLQSTTNNLYLHSSGGPGNNNVFLNPFPGQGDVGIGTQFPAAKLDVRGDILLVNGALYAPAAQERLRMIRGNVQQNGAIENGLGFTVTKVGKGQYQINFTPAFASRPSASVTQVFQDFTDFNAGGDTRDNAVIVGMDNTRMVVRTGDNAGKSSDRDFSFVVMGPR